MTIQPDEVKIVEAAWDAAQQRTAGPLVCVLAAASSNYEFMPLMISAALALAAPWPLLYFTLLSPERIYLIQLALFLGLLAVLSWPSLSILFTPRSIRRANAHRAALGQFMTRGVGRSASQSGVLLYVSQRERYARIIADDAAAKAIPQAQWQMIIDALIARLSAGQTCAGLASASIDCANLLAPHFPPSSPMPAPHRQHFHVV